LKIEENRNDMEEKEVKKNFKNLNGMKYRSLMLAFLLVGSRTQDPNYRLSGASFVIAYPMLG